MSVTWLATALLLSLAVSGTSSTTPELELGLNNNQLAVLVPPTHLVTFTPSVSVGVVLDALTARLPLQPLQKCGFSTSAGISVVRGKIFRDVLLATVPQLAAVDLRRGLPKGLVLGVVTCSGGEAWKVVSAPDQHRSHAGKDLWKKVGWKYPRALAAAKKAWQARQERIKTQGQEYPYLAAETMGDTLTADLQWLYQFVTHHWGELHPFPNYTTTNQTGLFSLETGEVLPHTGFRTHRSASMSNEEIRLGMAADWGSGTREAAYVSHLLVDGFVPHHTIHIGDVYYVGTPDEVASNALGIAPEGVKYGVKWPQGTHSTWALNGNHETYSRCYGYFDHWLPTIGRRDPSSGRNVGQKTSYFSLENEHWRVINLDTGYGTYSPLIDSHDNKQPAAVVDWLKNVVKLGDPSDTRGIVFVSHHQYRSAFDTPYLSTPQQVQAILPQGRTVLWLWGHEHRLGFYKAGAAANMTLNAYARCLGVGGFPVELDPIPKDARQAGLEVYDDREYELVDGTFKVKIGYNGFSRLRFNQNKLGIEYWSLKLGPDGKVSNTSASLLVSEEFTTLSTGSVNLTNFTIVNKNLTRVSNVE